MTSLRVQLEPPSKSREAEFIDAVARSTELHLGLVTPPDEAEKYQAFLKHTRSPWRVSLFVILKSGGDLIGVINIDSMIRGAFQSCGRWRDHERWAILAEEWKGSSR